MTTIHRTLAASLLFACALDAQVAWSQVATANSPPAFAGHCWDTVRGVLVTYGGDFAGVPVNSMRQWDGASWSSLNPSNRPSARTRPAMAFDQARGVAVLFGGGPNPTNDTWTWDGTDWTQESPTNVPPVRWGAAMAYDEARQRCVLFGGFVPSGLDANDVWEWDGSDWTQVTPIGASPPARGAHRMVYDPTIAAVRVVGGFSTPQFDTVNDTWNWNGVSWTPGPALPIALCDQSMCYDPTRQRVVLFGGLEIINGFATDLNGTMELDGSWLVRTPSTPPSARNACTGAWDPVQRVFVSAGGTTAAAQIFNDTYTYAPVASADSTAFGFGCLVTNGARLEERSLPYVGLPFELAITDASPAAAFGLMVFGGSDTNWSGTPLPLDLTVLGAPSCQLLVSLDVALTVPMANGSGVAVWNLPNLPAAVGSVFFTQGVVIDPTTPLPFPVDMTDGRRLTIGNP